MRFRRAPAALRGACKRRDAAQRGARQAVQQCADDRIEIGRCQFEFDSNRTLACVVPEEIEAEPVAEQAMQLASQIVRRVAGHRHSQAHISARRDGGSDAGEAAGTGGIKWGISEDSSRDRAMIGDGDRLCRRIVEHGVTLSACP